MSLTEQDKEFKKWAEEQGLSINSGIIQSQQQFERINTNSNAADEHLNLLKSIERESIKQSELINSINQKVLFWFWLTIIGLVVSLLVYIQ